MNEDNDPSILIHHKLVRYVRVGRSRKDNHHILHELRTIKEMFDHQAATYDMGCSMTVPSISSFSDFILFFFRYEHELHRLVTKILIPHVLTQLTVMANTVNKDESS